MISVGPIFGCREVVANIRLLPIFVCAFEDPTTSTLLVALIEPHSVTPSQPQTNHQQLVLYGVEISGRLKVLVRCVIMSNTTPAGTWCVAAQSAR